jgi:hypothetical protein
VRDLPPRRRLFNDHTQSTSSRTGENEGRGDFATSPMQSHWTKNVERTGARILWRLGQGRMAPSQGAQEMMLCHK